MTNDLSKSNLLFEIFTLGMQTGIEGISTRLSPKERLDKALKEMEAYANHYGYKMEDFDKVVGND